MRRRRGTKRRMVHGFGHSMEEVPAGYVLALCGELVPMYEISDMCMTCPDCLQASARTLLSTAKISGSGRGAARRAAARAQRRAQRRRGGGRR